MRTPSPCTVAQGGTRHFSQLKDLVREAQWAYLPRSGYSPLNIKLAWEMDRLKTVVTLWNHPPGTFHRRIPISNPRRQNYILNLNFLGGSRAWYHTSCKNDVDSTELSLSPCKMHSTPMERAFHCAFSGMVHPNKDQAHTHKKWINLRNGLHVAKAHAPNNQQQPKKKEWIKRAFSLQQLWSILKSWYTRWMRMWIDHQRQMIESFIHYAY